MGDFKIPDGASHISTGNQQKFIEKFREENPELFGTSIFAEKFGSGNQIIEDIYDFSTIYEKSNNGWSEKDLKHEESDFSDYYKYYGGKTGDKRYKIGNEGADVLKRLGIKASVVMDKKETDKILKDLKINLPENSYDKKTGAYEIRAKDSSGKEVKRFFKILQNDDDKGGKYLVFNDIKQDENGEYVSNTRTLGIDKNSGKLKVINPDKAAENSTAVSGASSETLAKYSVSGNDIQLEKHLGNNYDISKSSIEDLLNKDKTGKIKAKLEEAIGEKIDSKFFETQKKFQLSGNRVVYNSPEGEHQLYYDKKSGDFVDAIVSKNKNGGYDIEALKSKYTDVTVSRENSKGNRTDLKYSQNEIAVGLDKDEHYTELLLKMEDLQNKGMANDQYPEFRKLQNEMNTYKSKSIAQFQKDDKYFDYNENQWKSTDK